MRNKRSIIIKVIDNKITSNKRLAEFFAKKYSENSLNYIKEKS